MACWCLNGRDIHGPARRWGTRERWVLQLQSKWQEVSERQHRAKVRNRQLLQDFQRAAATVEGLAARIAAMGAIRAEYEKQLERRFPQRQQKLNKEGTSVPYQKQGELNLNDHLGRQEGKRVMQTDIDRTQSSSVHAGPSHLLGSSPHPFTNTLPDTYFHTLKIDSLAYQSVPLNQNYSDFTWRPMAHISCSRQAQHQKGVSQTRATSDCQCNISMETMGSQDNCGVAQPFLNSLPSPASQPFDPHWLLLPVQPLSGWFGLCGASPPRPQFTPSTGPWLGFGYAGCQLLQHQKNETCMTVRKWDKNRGCNGGCSQEADRGLRQEKPCDQSLELDVNPVRLCDVHESGGETSSVCSGVKREETPVSLRKTKERRGRSQICTYRKSNFCQGFHHDYGAHMGHSAKTCVHSVTAKQRNSESSGNEGETASVSAPGDTEQAEKANPTQESGVECSETETEMGNGDEEERQPNSQGEESEEYTDEEEDDGDGWEGSGENGETGEDDGVDLTTEEEVKTSEEGGSFEAGETEDSPEQEWEETGICEEKGSKGTGEEDEEMEEEDQDDDRKGEEEEDGSQDGGYSEDNSEEEGDAEEGRQEEGVRLHGEWDDTDSWEEREEEDVVRGNFSRDEEEGNVEGGDGEIEERVVTNSKEEESEEMTDSDDEIITSRLDCRASKAKKDRSDITGKSEAAEKLREIEEEEEEEEEDDTGEEENLERPSKARSSSAEVVYGKVLFEKVVIGDDNGESGEEEEIEVLLAPNRRSPGLQSLDIMEQDGPVLGKGLRRNLSHDPPRQKEKNPAVKTRALRHDSEMDTEEDVLGGGELTICDTDDGQDSLDDFYY